MQTQRKVDALMGFLDKLNNLFQATLTNQAPLADTTERKYYEIVFNALRVVHIASYRVVKKYVDSTLGQPCDEEILKRALKYVRTRVAEDGKTYYVNYEDSDLVTGKPQEMCEIRSEIIKKTPYAKLDSQKSQIFGVCFADQINHIKSLIAEALDIPLENANKAFLSQAVGKIQADLKGKEDYNSLAYLLYIAFKQSFFAGNNHVKDAVIQHYFNVIEDYAQDESTAVYFGAMALRAARFEKFGGKENGYETLSTQECEEFLKSCEAFDDQPFDNYPMLLGRYVENIKKSSAFYSIKTHKLFDLRNFWEACSRDDYFMDAVCYYGWVEIKNQYEDEATSISEMADMIYDFALNHVS